METVIHETPQESARRQRREMVARVEDLPAIEAAVAETQIAFESALAAAKAASDAAVLAHDRLAEAQTARDKARELAERTRREKQWLAGGGRFYPE